MRFPTHCSVVCIIIVHTQFPPSEFPFPEFETTSKEIQLEFESGANEAEMFLESDKQAYELMEGSGQNLGKQGCCYNIIWLN